jgi:hypothetical protein
VLQVHGLARPILLHAFAAPALAFPPYYG